jgi:hypothetical protein
VTTNEESFWCIPFEWCGAPKTFISITKAKQIAAEILAAVAEAEKRELRRHLDIEVDRCRTLTQQVVEIEAKLEASEQLRRKAAKKARKDNKR